LHQWKKFKLAERKYSAGKKNPLRYFGRRLGTLGNPMLIF